MLMFILAMRWVLSETNRALVTCFANRRVLHESCKHFARSIGFCRVGAAQARLQPAAPPPPQPKLKQAGSWLRQYPSIIRLRHTHPQTAAMDKNEAHVLSGLPCVSVCVCSAYDMYSWHMGGSMPWWGMDGWMCLTDGCPHMHTAHDQTHPSHTFVRSGGWGAVRCGAVWACACALVGRKIHAQTYVETNTARQGIHWCAVWSCRSLPALERNNPYQRDSQSSHTWAS